MWAGWAMNENLSLQGCRLSSGASLKVRICASLTTTRVSLLTYAQMQSGFHHKQRNPHGMLAWDAGHW